MTDRLTLDQINSDQLDQLYDRLAELERDLRDTDAENLELAAHNDQTCEAVQRRDQAEAAIGRIRHLAASRSFMAGPNAVDVVRVSDVLTALNPQETP